MAVDILYDLKEIKNNYLLKRYYTNLRSKYLRIPLRKFEEVFRNKIQKYKIDFKYKNRLNILFCYDNQGWLKDHLLPTFNNFGNVYELIFKDKLEKLKSDRENNGRRLLEMVQNNPKYDVIFIGGARGHIAKEILNQVMDTYHIPIINFQFDDKQIFTKKINNIEYGSLEAAKGSILTFTNSKYCIDWYLKEDCPAIYLPEGTSKELFYNNDFSKKNIDVCFLGTRYGIRERFEKHFMRNKIKFVGYGRGWESGEITIEEQRKIINNSKIILSHEGIGYSFWPSHVKGKTFDFAMAGACILTSYSSELADWFTINKEILCYYNLDDAVDIIRYYLNKPDELCAFGNRAQKRALHEHTWTHRFDYVFKLLEEH